MAFIFYRTWCSSDSVSESVPNLKPISSYPPQEKLVPFWHKKNLLIWNQETGGGLEVIFYLHMHKQFKLSTTNWTMREMKRLEGLKMINNKKKVKINKTKNPNEFKSSRLVCVIETPFKQHFNDHMILPFIL